MPNTLDRGVISDTLFPRNPMTHGPSAAFFAAATIRHHLQSGDLYPEQQLRSDLGKLSALLEETRQYVDSLAADPEEAYKNGVQAAAQRLDTLRKIIDPAERFAAVTKVEACVTEILSQLAIIREGAVLNMQESGLSFRAIADRAGFSRGRAQALVTRARIRKTNSEA
jgi:DNA-binding CsgD family transcriptional regulator